MKFNKDTQSLRNNINRGGRSGPQNKGITKKLCRFPKKTGRLRIDAALQSFSLKQGNETFIMVF